MLLFSPTETGLCGFLSVCNSAYRPGGGCSGWYIRLESFGWGAIGKTLGTLVGATASLFAGGGVGFPVAGKTLQLYDRRVEQRDSVARVHVAAESGQAEELLEDGSTGSLEGPSSQPGSIPQQVIHDEAETKV